MEKNDEIYNVLNNLGLDENEILSIEKRNKFLTTTTEDDVNEVIMDDVKYGCKGKVIIKSNRK